MSDNIFNTASPNTKSERNTQEFHLLEDRFADIQLLRYQLDGFDNLSLQQKTYLYYLSKATLAGRNITIDQNGRYNLAVMQVLEAIYVNYDSDKTTDDFIAFTTYLKQVWFASGIYHHYSQDKFQPKFSIEFFQAEYAKIPTEKLPLKDKQTREQLYDTLSRVIFDANFMPKCINQNPNDDIVMTSAANFYENVSQSEAEQYYKNLNNEDYDEQPSWGLNSRLVKENGALKEETYSTQGRYAEALKEICYWLRKASDFAENDEQKHVIALLIQYYETGNLAIFDQMSIAWVQNAKGQIDFINGYIEVYGDPLGIKGTWEGIVHYKDEEATKQARQISESAQWFEDHSPVDARFKKKSVQGVTANAVCAAMLGGEEYPASAIGINLPNASWIRAKYGSKSITIDNLIKAYQQASLQNGFYDEFVDNPQTIEWIRQYNDQCDNLHTLLHECVGHGSGRVLPGVDPNALKAYGNTIEEARADLFALYFLADEKLIELGLLDNPKAFEAQYYTYLLNGLMTQLARIELGQQIEEAHMRNRALIARWVMANSDGNVALKVVNGKHFLEIHDYQKLRQSFAMLLCEIQRIKSEGDYDAARDLVEKYGVTIDADLHQEIRTRYNTLNIAPYKGFINPLLIPVLDNDGAISDIRVDYSEPYDEQMLRYSRQYPFQP